MSFLKEFIVAETVLGGDLENGNGGVGWAGNAGAAVAVGLRKVADGLAANEVVLQFAVGDKIDGLGGNAIVIDVVSANESLAIEGLQAGIVNDLELIGQDARVKAGGEWAVGARFGSELGTSCDETAVEQPAQSVSAGVGAEKNRAVVLLFDHGGFAEIGERGDLFNGLSSRRDPAVRGP
jgi:hypothetical protein